MDLCEEICTNIPHWYTNMMQNDFTGMENVREKLLESYSQMLQPDIPKEDQIKAYEKFKGILKSSNSYFVQELIDEFCEMDSTQSFTQTIKLAIEQGDIELAKDLVSNYNLNKLTDKDISELKPIIEPIQKQRSEILSNVKKNLNQYNISIDDTNLDELSFKEIEKINTQLNTMISLNESNSQDKLVVNGITIGDLDDIDQEYDITLEKNKEELVERLAKYSIEVKDSLEGLSFKEIEKINTQLDTIESKTASPSKNQLVIDGIKIKNLNSLERGYNTILLNKKNKKNIEKLKEKLKQYEFNVNDKNLDELSFKEIEKIDTQLDTIISLNASNAPRNLVIEYVKGEEMDIEDFEDLECQYNNIIKENKKLKKKLDKYSIEIEDNLSPREIEKVNTQLDTIISKIGNPSTNELVIDGIKVENLDDLETEYDTILQEQEQENIPLATKPSQKSIEDTKKKISASQKYKDKFGPLATKPSQKSRFQDSVRSKNSSKKLTHAQKYLQTKKDTGQRSK